MQNPYAPGAGTRPPQLAGRDAELDAFTTVLRRIGRRLPERSLIVSGLRGVGKTVLLLEFQSLAEHHGWSTAKLEARPGFAFRPAVTRSVHQALRSLSRRHQATDALKRVLRTLKSFAVTTDPAGAITLRLDVDPEPGRADSGDAETDLTELLHDLGEAAAASQTGVGIFIDEMQDIAGDDLAALVGAFHEVSQRQLPVLVVGTGLPHLPTALSEAKTYAERLFRYREVGRLERGAATEALVLPAERLGVRFTPEAVRRLLDLTGRYPYFIQEYGKHVWDVAAASPIGIDDVEEAAIEARRELDVGFFGSRYQRTSPKEREYLAAMAGLGDGPVGTSAIAERLGRSITDVSSYRDNLIKKGLIYSAERGFVAFTLPTFAAYVLEQEQ